MTPPSAPEALSRDALATRITLAQVEWWRDYLARLFAGEPENLREINELCDLARISVEAALRSLPDGLVGEPTEAMIDAAVGDADEWFCISDEQCTVRNPMKCSDCRRQAAVAIRAALATRPPSGEQAVRDAARYQWLCDKAGLSLGGVIGNGLIELDRWALQKTKEHTLAAAIDAALSDAARSEK